MTFTTTLEKFTGKNARVYSLYFPVPNDIAEQFIEGSDRRVLCTINNQKEISSGLMPDGENWFILVNQQLQKELYLAIGEQVTLSLKKDTSEFGMEMPDEFAAVLEQDYEGNDFFQQLTPGKKRNLIYIVSKVKNIDSRLNKALAIMDHLKEFRGKLDFKALNEKIKEYNQLNKLK